MNDLEDIIVRIQTLHPFPAGVREDGFANIREADIAVKQSFASGGQLSRSLLSPWSLLLGVPKAREFFQRGPSALQSSVVLAVVLIRGILVRYWFDIVQLTLRCPLHRRHRHRRLTAVVK